MESTTDREEAARIKRQGTDQAIQLALESKWEEAVTVNRSILAIHATDVDTWNRLGKSLLELGRYADALEAYSKSLELDPVNTIAKRNVDRLSTLQDVEPRRAEGVVKVAQDLFIEEVGKTGVTQLQGVTREILATLTAGDEVYLEPGRNLISIKNAGDEIIGSIEPKLGLRLLRLIEGGNRYAAAVKSVSDRDAELIIKEIYRDPSQTRLSFPAVGGDSNRPYIRESLLRLGDDDDDDVIEDDSDSEDWSDNESDTGSDSGGFTSFQNVIERDVDDEEDEE
ncbi:MAG: tetratricopeptide repeat protein [Dehalococcoidia bacterium]